MLSTCNVTSCNLLLVMLTLTHVTVCSYTTDDTSPIPELALQPLMESVMMIGNVDLMMEILAKVRAQREGEEGGSCPTTCSSVRC